MKMPSYLQTSNVTKFNVKLTSQTLTLKLQKFRQHVDLEMSAIKT